ncbi:MAG: type II toxin-antitoxin system RelB/DinJ family antitoxin [Patescibacteria group bacterium]
MKKKRTSSHLHLRLPAKLKKQAQHIIEASGLDVSSAVRLYFAQIVLHQAIPLKFLTVNGLPPEFERELHALAEDKENIEGPFTPEEAIQHLRER